MNELNLNDKPGSAVPRCLQRLVRRMDCSDKETSAMVLCLLAEVHPGIEAQRAYEAACRAWMSQLESQSHLLRLLRRIVGWRRIVATANRLGWCIDATKRLWHIVPSLVLMMVCRSYKSKSSCMFYCKSVIARGLQARRAMLALAPCSIPRAGFAGALFAFHRPTPYAPSTSVVTGADKAKRITRRNPHKTKMQRERGRRMDGKKSPQSLAAAIRRAWRHWCEHGRWPSAL